MISALKLSIAAEQFRPPISTPLACKARLHEEPRVRATQGWRYPGKHLGFAASILAIGSDG